MGREQDWETFSKLVEDHVADYTIHQYGDYPDDGLTHWTPQECINMVAKYVVRFGKNARGEKEQLRDMLKIAHFAQVAYVKMKGEEGL